MAVRLLESEASRPRPCGRDPPAAAGGHPVTVRFVLGRQTNQAKLTLSRYRHGSATDLFADCLAAAADDLIAANGGQAWDESRLQRLLDAVREELPAATLEVVSAVEQALAVAGQVESRLAELTNPAAPATADVRAQLDDLVHPGWVTATGRRRLGDVRRYLRAMVQRLERLPGDLGPNAERSESVARVTAAWHRPSTAPPAAPTQPRPRSAGCSRLRVSATSPSPWAPPIRCPRSGCCGRSTSSARPTWPERRHPGLVPAPAMAEDVGGPWTFPPTVDLRTTGPPARPQRGRRAGRAAGPRGAAAAAPPSPDQRSGGWWPRWCC